MQYSNERYDIGESDPFGQKRVLGFEGAANFRDFGGYLAAEGMRVRWGRLYRSNKLSGLTDGDQAQLDALGIHTIFDLRARHEREADPTAWTHASLNTRTYRPGHKRPLVEMALDYPPDEAGAQALMTQFYETMPTTMAHAFGAIIQEIAAGAFPCIIHCSAGKDRTGVACALILAALGVDPETIIEDYALTEALKQSQSDRANTVLSANGVHASPNKFSPEAIKIMAAARPDYLQSSFTAIEREHGSVEAYFRDALAIDEATLTQLRTNLLEPA